MKPLPSLDTSSSGPSGVPRRPREPSSESCSACFSRTPKPSVATAWLTLCHPATQEVLDGTVVKRNEIERAQRCHCTQGRRFKVGPASRGVSTDLGCERQRID